jgi:hypothetical protein
MRPLLAHHWPLVLVGATLTVLGSLLAWLMFLQQGGKFSITPRLDAGPTVRLRGTVRSVEAPFELDGRSWQRVYYAFAWQPEPAAHPSSVDGESFVEPGRLRAGDPVDVEVLASDPNESRVAGGVLYIDRAWLHPRFWLVVMVTPGAIVLLGWSAAFFRLRHVLVHGDVSVGRVTSITPVRFLVPQMLRVAYEFRDHHAVVRRHGHWVRVHGELGARLERQMHTGWLEPMPVLHDRRLPQWNRMVLPQDFLPAAARDAMAPNGAT